MSGLAHLNFIKNTGKTLKTINGEDIEVWELEEIKDEQVLTSWAKHFREQYCIDEEIDFLLGGTPFTTRKEYLNEIIFPDKKKSPGPSIRSGDFSEILITDFLEFILNFWVPRGKYKEKYNRNESIKGVDILGFKMINSQPDPDDIFATVEVKAHLRNNNKYNNALQNSINDSSKDILRQAQTLNAIKRRSLTSKNFQQAMLIERFQNKADRPYIYTPYAVAVLTDAAYQEDLIQNSDSSNHSNVSNLKMIVFKGCDLMTFVHELYERAANEA